MKWQVLQERGNPEQETKGLEFVGMGAVKEDFLKEVLFRLSSVCKGTTASNGWSCAALGSAQEVHSPGWRCTS